MLNGMSLKELSKEYYLFPKNVEYYDQNEVKINEHVDPLLEILDLFENISDDNLKKYYIVKRKTGKKLNAKQVKEIKESKGTVREKSEKFGVSMGTISKINNNKY